VFEAAFGLNKRNKIYIQDLTSNDIRLYVKDTLEAHRLRKDEAGGAGC
jgi:hypothetical protein